MQSDIRKIQSQLNKLCSQHDELMTLLDIYDYMPNLKHLQQTNRSIASKINNFQHQIQELLQTNSSVKIREDIHLKMKQEEFIFSIEATQMQLKDLSSKIQQQRTVIAQLEKGRESASNVLTVKEKTKIRLNKMLEDFESEMGTLLAKQMVILKQQKQPNKNKEAVIQKATAEQSYDYQKLMHEIELQVLQLEPPPMIEYFQFSYNQLKKEILVVNSKVQNFDADSNSSQAAKQEKEFLSMKVGLLRKLSQQLEFRVIALKRFCGQQLLFLYEEQADKMSVCELQRQINEKLRELQHLISILKSNIALQTEHND